MISPKKDLWKPTKDCPYFALVLVVRQVEQYISSCLHLAGDEGGQPDRGLIAETGRLFLRNLPYQATEADLAMLFKEYGELSEVHLILDRYLSFSHQKMNLS